MQVGRFTIDIGGPYPVWIGIKDDCGNEMRLSHRELRDLEYAVSWAIREAKSRLKGPVRDDSGEV